MTPVLVHRYKLPIELAIEQLLGKQAAGEGWEISIEGDDLVIDIHGPSEVTFRVGDYEYTVDGRAAPASNEAAKDNTPTETPAEPPRKGGALARQAGIICGEKGFWTFVAKKFGTTIASADEAAAWLKAQCGVSSRVDFDYDEGKAANFRQIDGAYRLWLEGFD